MLLPNSLRCYFDLTFEIALTSRSALLRCHFDLVRSISKENAPFFFAADGSQQGEACLLEGGFEEIGMSSWTSECLASNYGISSGHPNV